MENIIDILDNELYCRRHKVWAEIDLGALVRNYRRIEKLVKERSEHTAVIPVIKADAYGHGAVKSMQALRSAGARMFAVSSVAEAIELRRAFPDDDADILILGYSLEDDADLICKYDLIQTVFSLDYARSLDAACRRLGADTKMRVHIKLDTGMNRLGFCAADSICAAEEIRSVSEFGHLKIEGIFSHFACADEHKSPLTDVQLGRFENMTAELERMGVDAGMRHICNSAGILRSDLPVFDAVRAGIILYGLMPSDEFGADGFETVMTLKTRVAHVHEIDVGDHVSYGADFTADKKMRIATLPIGYADGFIRAYSGAYVTAGGRKCPIVGRVCMDQCMADVSGVDVKTGDEVILFGDRGMIEKLAEMSQTISYEVLCLIAKRVPRIYIQNEGK